MPNCPRVPSSICRGWRNRITRTSCATGSINCWGETNACPGCRAARPGFGVGRCLVCDEVPVLNQLHRRLVGEFEEFCGIAAGRDVQEAGEIIPDAA